MEGVPRAIQPLDGSLIRRESGSCFQSPHPSSNLADCISLLPCCPEGALSGGLVVVGSHRRSGTIPFCANKIRIQEPAPNCPPVSALLLHSASPCLESYRRRLPKNGTQRERKSSFISQSSTKAAIGTALHCCAALDPGDHHRQFGVLWRWLSALRSTRAYLLWPRDNDQAELRPPTWFGAPSLATPATGLQRATFKLLPELQPLVVAQSSAQILPSPIGAVVGTSLSSRHQALQRSTAFFNQCSRSICAADGCAADAPTDKYEFDLP